VSVLHLIAPSERIARTVYKSLESAFSGALTVEAVEVESLNRVVLRTVGYSAENGFPLNVQIEQVGIELGFPVVDIIFGRWTPVKCIRRVELVRPTAVYNLSSGHQSPGKFDFDTLVQALLAREELRELSAVVEVSEGEFEVSGLPVHFDGASGRLTADGAALYAFELSARCEELEDLPISIQGSVDLADGEYSISVTGQSVPVVGLASLLKQKLPGLSELDVSGGSTDVSFVMEGGAAVRLWKIEGTFVDTVVAHRPSGLRFTGVSGGFEVRPEIGGQGNPTVSPDGLGDVGVAGKLLADSLQVEISSLDKSTLKFDRCTVAFSASSDELVGLKAHGTVNTERLSIGGVTASDVGCEFRYSADTLEFTQIAGLLMGGELGGQLSVSLVDDGVLGEGHGRIRGLKSSEVPIAGISNVIDASLDGTASLSFSSDRGYGLVGRLIAQKPKVAGLPFDDAVLDFTLNNGIASVDSLVVGLHGTRFVLKGNADGRSFGSESDYGSSS